MKKRICCIVVIIIILILVFNGYMVAKRIRVETFSPYKAVFNMPEHFLRHQLTKEDYQFSESPVDNRTCYEILSGDNNFNYTFYFDEYGLVKYMVEANDDEALSFFRDSVTRLIKSYNNNKDFHIESNNCNADFSEFYHKVCNAGSECRVSISYRIFSNWIVYYNVSNCSGRTTITATILF